MQAAEGGLKEKIFNQAFKVGLEVDRLKREGKSVPFLLELQHALFDKLVFSKVRERFGGRVRFFISGAAALNREIAEWFHAAGIVILEGYGMTETSAGAAVNHPDEYKFGTRRPRVPRHRGQDRRGRRDPDQGPGRHGGLPQPARGDRGGAHRGRLAAHRRHRRARRATATCGSPTARRTCSRPPAASTSPRRPSSRSSRRSAPTPASSWCTATSATSCVALITLDPEAMAGLGRPRTGRPARRTPRSCGSDAGAGRWSAGTSTSSTRRLNRWETIKKWIILDHDLTVESGELTPSMKVKRKVVEDNYKDDIARMYS